MTSMEKSKEKTSIPKNMLLPKEEMLEVKKKGQLMDYGNHLMSTWTVSAQHHFGNTAWKSLRVACHLKKIKCSFSAKETVFHS